MANILDVISKIIRPYYYHILIFIVFIIFIVVGYYGYKQIKSHQKNKLSDVANANRRNQEAIVYFFHVDWCPHCKKALPEWKSFVSSNDGTLVNGYKIKCIDVDCTNETSDVTDYINKYKIDSYPTVKLVHGTTIIDFETRISKHTLETFVNTML